MKFSSLRDVGLVVAVILTLALDGSSASSAAPAPTPTRVFTYSPWSAKGRLAPSVVVAKTVTGSCWTSSIAVNSKEAFRCSSGSSIYDPCFAPSVHHVVTVACANSPWSDVVVMHLDATLPHLIAQPKDAALVWAQGLVNGVRCVIDTGTGIIVAHTTMNYSCAPGSGWASFPSRTGSSWSAWYVERLHGTSPKRIAVTSVWY